jgi:hypothetical protein
MKDLQERAVTQDLVDPENSSFINTARELETGQGLWEVKFVPGEVVARESEAKQLQLSKRANVEEYGIPSPSSFPSSLLQLHLLLLPLLVLFIP